MNETGKGSYLWHLREAARHDLIARSSQRRGFYWDAQQAAAKAKWHRDQAAIIDLERRAA